MTRPVRRIRRTVPLQFPGSALEGVTELKGTLFKHHTGALWLCALGAVLAAHGIWLAVSDVPPPWDMAYHQLQGWDYLEAFQRGDLRARFASLSPSYPPLYYLIEAFVLSLSRSPDGLVFWSNLPGLFLLSLGTWRLASRGLPARAAVWAGILPLLFPFSAWVGRESLLDGLLAGLAALAGYLVYRSDWFQDLRWTLLFGLVCAAGVMTKWTFPLYLAGPVVFGVAAARDRRRALLCLFGAALLAIPWTLPYYAPNLAELAARYPTTEQTGLIPWKPYPRHGEPGLNNVWGWIYYPRVFFNYFLCLPLAVPLAWGVWRGLRSESAPRGEAAPDSSKLAAYLWWWLLSGTVLLTFLTPKDPRFALPLAAPLAVLLLLGWRGRPRACDAIFAVACLQFLLVSFPNPLGAGKLAFGGRTDDHDYQNLQREWVLFSTRYFDVTGPPTREDWRLDDILELLPDGARVGFLPDLARFHPGALQLAARRKGRTVAVFKVGDSGDWPRRLQGADYVVGKTGPQGITFITGYNAEVESRLRSQGWTVAGRWALPDGSDAVLYRSLVAAQGGRSNPG